MELAHVIGLYCLICTAEQGRGFRGAQIINRVFLIGCVILR